MDKQSKSKAFHEENLNGFIFLTAISKDMLKLKINKKEISFDVNDENVDPEIQRDFAQIIKVDENIQQLSKLSTKCILSILNNKDFRRPPIKYLSSFILKMCDGREISEQLELLSVLTMFGVSSMSLKDLIKLQEIVQVANVDIFPQLENVISIKEESSWSEFEHIPFAASSMQAQIQKEIDDLQ